jgi:hypothetical protein
MTRFSDAEEAVQSVSGLLGSLLREEVSGVEGVSLNIVALGLARTTSFSHERRREFERLREGAEERGAGLWGVCPRVDGY